MQLRVHISNKRIAEYIITIMVWLAFLKNAFEGLHVALTGAGIVLGILTIGLCFHRFMSKRIIASWICIGLLGIFNCLFVKSLTFENLIPLLFLYFPIALYFYDKDELNPGWWEINYFAYSSYLLYKILTSSNNYNLFYAMSRNVISYFLLVWLILLFIVYKKKYKQIPFRDIFYYFIICIIANGRGGIISGGLLLLFFWISEIIESKKYTNLSSRFKQILLFLLLIASISYFTLNFSMILSEYLYRFTEEVSLRSTEARYYAWGLYINSCFDNITCFLFGCNTYELLPEAYAGNLHNSFLAVHSRLGLIGLIAVCVCVINAIQKAIKMKDYGILAFILIFSIRAFTDHIFPGKEGDIALWLIFFYQLKLSKFDNKASKSCME